MRWSAASARKASSTRRRPLGFDRPVHAREQRGDGSRARVERGEGHHTTAGKAASRILEELEGLNARLESYCLARVGSEDPPEARTRAFQHLRDHARVRAAGARHRAAPAALAGRQVHADLRRHRAAAGRGGGGDGGDPAVPRVRRGERGERRDSRHLLLRVPNAQAQLQRNFTREWAHLGSAGSGNATLPARERQLSPRRDAAERWRGVFATGRSRGEHLCRGDNR
ncbi:uncharacterized protein SOCE26_092050 [Sorangium cellulosum]|uniref:Uncharacterized protein n=1 Tax=Sorangium cellulosum TaxID=56 RepID=A0A2L0F864_SORCE|nr:uncharacterized protein SOCE26_092050 [Sorangium cellulosum]